MQTSELVEYLKSQDFTDAEAYNTITGDMRDFLSDEEVDRSQKAIHYLAYKLRTVCFRAIRELKAGGEP